MIILIIQVNVNEYLLLPKIMGYKIYLNHSQVQMTLQISYPFGSTL